VGDEQPAFARAAEMFDADFVLVNQNVIRQAFDELVSVEFAGAVILRRRLGQNLKNYPGREQSAVTGALETRGRTKIRPLG